MADATFDFDKKISQLKNPLLDNISIFLPANTG